MAKEDFCFTYYDGDAARDMAHMNRLERGCYNDLIISQRKFGHLSLAQIKKVLSKDFDECWPAIELVLVIDTEGKYFIEWLENSIQKMRKQSKKQKDNIQKRFGSTNDIPNDDLVIPESDLVIPLGNENGDVNEKEGFKEGVTGETIVSQKEIQNLGLPANVLEAAEMNQFTMTQNRNTDFVKQQWKIFLTERTNDPPLRIRQLLKNLPELYQYFLNWIRNKKPANGKEIKHTPGRSMVFDKP